MRLPQIISACCHSFNDIILRDNELVSLVTLSRSFSANHNETVHAVTIFLREPQRSSACCYGLSPRTTTKQCVLSRPFSANHNEAVRAVTIFLREPTTKQCVLSRSFFANQQRSSACCHDLSPRTTTKQAVLSRSFSANFTSKQCMHVEHSVDDKYKLWISQKSN